MCCADCGSALKHHRLVIVHNDAVLQGHMRGSRIRRAPKARLDLSKPRDERRLPCPLPAWACLQPPAPPLTWMCQRTALASTRRSRSRPLRTMSATLSWCVTLVSIGQHAVQGHERRGGAWATHAAATLAARWARPVINPVPHRVTSWSIMGPQSSSDVA